MQPLINPAFIPLADGWRRNLWLSLLVVGSAAFSSVFACATPFAALAAVAVMTLVWRDALRFMLAVWLANQAVGFFLLDYPQTADSFLWGAVMGGATLISTFAARQAMVKFQKSAALPAVLIVFFAALMSYELVLFFTALTPLGGLSGFTFDVIGRVVSVNMVALAGLYGLNRLSSIMGFTVAPAKALAR